jgi:hypothetical protein
MTDLSVEGMNSVKQKACKFHSKAEVLSIQGQDQRCVPILRQAPMTERVVNLVA